jgi:hypothetical protein
MWIQAYIHRWRIASAERLAVPPERNSVDWKNFVKYLVIWGMSVGVGVSKVLSEKIPHVYGWGRGRRKTSEQGKPRTEDPDRVGNHQVVRNPPSNPTEELQSLALVSGRGRHRH